MKMPIYKSGKSKKEGLQKYCVRINYIADSGEYKQITRTAYGIDSAKYLERELEEEIKIQREIPIKKMTVKQLFEEYIEVKKYEVRETTLDKSDRVIKRYILPSIENVRIDKLSIKILQDWKISIEESKLSLITKKNIYTELRTMLNYAVRIEHIPKHQLSKVR
jgi:hypothetical protein